MLWCDGAEPASKEEICIYGNYQWIVVVIRMEFVLSVEVMVLVQVHVALHKVVFIIPVPTAQRCKSGDLLKLTRELY